MNWKVPAAVVGGVVLGVTIHERVTGRAEEIVAEMEELQGFMGPGDFEDPHAFLDSLEDGQEDISEAVDRGIGEAMDRDMEEAPLPGFDDYESGVNLDDFFGGYSFEDMQQQVWNDLGEILGDEPLTTEEVAELHMPEMMPMFEGIAVDGVEATLLQMEEEGLVTRTSDGWVTNDS